MNKVSKGGMARLGPVFRNGLIIAVTYLLLVGMLVIGITPEQHDIQVGAPAPLDILASKDVTDTVTTEELRAAAAAAVALLILAFALFFWHQNRPESLAYGYAREVSEDEKALRQQLLSRAEEWLGTVEGSPEHHQLIDLYNAQQPLPVGYLVTYEDNWCAAFVTVAALLSNLEEIIPPECGCQRQIALFEGSGRWQEDESYVPLPGDVIYFAQKGPALGDCTGWANHVGIVAGTAGNYIKVIEGNSNNAVRYRYLHKNDPTIRGYGLPDYSGKCE
jgi:hypothetical protein